MVDGVHCDANQQQALLRQPALPLPVHPSYHPQDYVVTPANEQQYYQLMKWQGGDCPLLCLHGQMGSGKTHLAHCWAEQQDAQWLPHMHKKLHVGGRYVLDMQNSWPMHKGMEEDLFHLLHQVRDAGAMLLLISPEPHAQVNFTLPDVASRLRAAPFVQLGALDEALHAAMLYKQLGDRQLRADPAVIAYLVARMERSPVAIRNLVALLDTLSMQERRAVNLTIAKHALTHL